MSPISNKKSLKLITELTSKVDKLYKLNNTLLKLDKDIEDNNNNIIIFTNLNKDDKTEYTNKDNVIHFINSKLNT